MENEIDKNSFYYRKGYDDGFKEGMNKALEIICTYEKNKTTGNVVVEKWNNILTTTGETGNPFYKKWDNNLVTPI